MKADRLLMNMILWPLLLGFLLQPPPPPTPTPRPPTATPTPPPPTPTPSPTPGPTLPPSPTALPSPVPPAVTSPPKPRCLSGLEGLLLEAGSNSPLAGIKIVLKGEGWEAQTVTGSDGKFRFYGLCYGVGTVYVPDMTIVEGNPEVFFDGHSLLQLTLKATAQAVLTPTATPTPTPGTGLPSTGWESQLLPLAVILGATVLILRRLRRSSTL